MLKSVSGVLLLVALVLLVAGAVALPLFPQPFITFFCAKGPCPAEVSGGISLGYVLLFFGVVVGISAVVSRAMQSRRKQ